MNNIGLLLNKSNRIRAQSSLDLLFKYYHLLISRFSIKNSIVLVFFDSISEIEKVVYDDQVNSNYKLKVV